MTTQNPKIVAAAYCNDSVSLIGWIFPDAAKIVGCLGMALTRIDQTGKREVITTKLPFDGEDNADWKSQPSTVWPIQRMFHMDFTAKVGNTYTYEVQAMGGTPGNLVAIPGMLAVTNAVNVSTKVDDTFEVAFTRGTLSTQWMSRMIGTTPDGLPDFQKIIDALEDYANPNNVIRKTLVGNVPALLMAPVNECATDGGHVYSALYELSANQLVDHIKANLQHITLILGNTGADDFINAPARAALHAAGAKMYDRMIGNWGIAHNKSQVKVNKDGVPTDVTTGSTNWTNTGLGCQSNMACRIHNPAVAANFMDYWNRMLADNSEQALVFRRRNAQGYAPITLNDGTVIETYFQPSMDDKVKPKGASETVPLSPFLARVKGLIDDAAADGDSVICGEVFYPGTPSAINWFADAWNKNPQLCMFMTVSSSQALMGVKTIRRAGRPPLFTIATGREKEFGDFITELLKLPESHAITHGKIVVIINKRTKKYTVVFGSDNLGAKASYGNDENGVIVLGNEKLAWNVFVNMFDINQHYLSRAAARAAQYFQKATGYTGRLSTSDGWQAAWLSGYKAKLSSLIATGVWDGTGLVDKPGATPVLVVPYPKRKPKAPAAGTAEAGTGGTEGVVVPADGAGDAGTVAAAADAPVPAAAVPATATDLVTAPAVPVVEPTKA
ncbi:MAG: hypothetical protein WC028_23065 [Candidatus Obscuribacterales bacterium]